MVLAQDVAQASQASNILAQKKYDQDLAQYEKDKARYEEELKTYEANVKAQEAENIRAEKERVEAIAEAKRRAEQAKIDEAKSRAAGKAAIVQRLSAQGASSSKINLAVHKWEAQTFHGVSEKEWQQIVLRDIREHKASQRASAGLRAAGNKQIKDAQQKELQRLGGTQRPVTTITPSGKTVTENLYAQPTKVGETIITHRVPTAEGKAEKAQDFGKGFTTETKMYGYSTTGQAELDRQQAIKTYEAQQQINTAGVSVNAAALDKLGLSTIYQQGQFGYLKPSEIPKPTKPIKRTQRETVLKSGAVKIDYQPDKNLVASYLIPIKERSNVGYTRTGEPLQGAPKPTWEVQYKGKPVTFTDFGKAQKFTARVSPLLPSLTQYAAPKQSGETLWTVEGSDKKFKTEQAAKQFIKDEEMKVPLTHVRIPGVKEGYQLLDTKARTWDKLSKDDPTDLYKATMSGVGAVLNVGVGMIDLGGKLIDVHLLKQESKPTRPLFTPETHYDAGIIKATENIKLTSQYPYVTGVDGTVLEKFHKGAKEQWEKQTWQQNVGQIIAVAPLAVYDVVTGAGIVKGAARLTTKVTAGVIGKAAPNLISHSMSSTGKAGVRLVPESNGVKNNWIAPEQYTKIVDSPYYKQRRPAYFVQQTLPKAVKTGVTQIKTVVKERVKLPFIVKNTLKQTKGHVQLAKYEVGRAADKLLAKIPPIPQSVKDVPIRFRLGVQDVKSQAGIVKLQGKDVIRKQFDRDSRFGIGIEKTQAKFQPTIDKLKLGYQRVQTVGSDIKKFGIELDRRDRQLGSKVELTASLFKYQQIRKFNLFIDKSEKKLRYIGATTKNIIKYKAKRGVEKLDYFIDTTRNIIKYQTRLGIQKVKSGVQPLKHRVQLGIYDARVLGKDFTYRLEGKIKIQTRTPKGFSKNYAARMGHKNPLLSEINLQYTKASKFIDDKKFQASVIPSQINTSLRDKSDFKNIKIVRTYTGNPIKNVLLDVKYKTQAFGTDVKAIGSEINRRDIVMGAKLTSSVKLLRYTTVKKIKIEAAAYKKGFYNLMPEEYQTKTKFITRADSVEALRKQKQFSTPEPKEDVIRLLKEQNLPKWGVPQRGKGIMNVGMMGEVLKDVGMKGRKGMDIWGKFGSIRKAPAKLYGKEWDSFKIAVRRKERIAAAAYEKQFGKVTEKIATPVKTAVGGLKDTGRRYITGSTKLGKERKKAVQLINLPKQKTVRSPYKFPTSEVDKLKHYFKAQAKAKHDMINFELTVAKNKIRAKQLRGEIGFTKFQEGILNQPFRSTKRPMRLGYSDLQTVRRKGARYRDEISGQSVQGKSDRIALKDFYKGNVSPGSSTRNMDRYVNQFKKMRDKAIAKKQSQIKNVLELRSELKQFGKVRIGDAFAKPSKAFNLKEFAKGISKKKKSKFSTTESGGFVKGKVTAKKYDDAEKLLDEQIAKGTFKLNPDGTLMKPQGGLKPPVPTKSKLKHINPKPSPTGVPIIPTPSDKSTASKSKSTILPPIIQKKKKKKSDPLIGTTGSFIVTEEYIRTPTPSSPWNKIRAEIKTETAQSIIPIQSQTQPQRISERISQIQPQRISQPQAVKQDQPQALRQPSPQEPKPKLKARPKFKTRIPTKTVQRYADPLPPRKVRGAAAIIPPLKAGLKKKGVSEGIESHGFLGNTKLDNIVGLFKRETIMYGDKKIAKQIKKDKKVIVKADKIIGVKKKARKKKKEPKIKVDTEGFGQMMGKTKPTLNKTKKVKKSSFF